ncbi:uncharacterized protein LOC123781588 [Ursus americanus]|uniref:uncharacterized protein LOC123781588 n=1 Tax=Ursus americanus TaxID=9643 RepID=UPI001E679EDD|nr:uncharacterized protein LOC123781588 [Ursus americanus]
MSEPGQGHLDQRQQQFTEITFAPTEKELGLSSPGVCSLSFSCHRVRDDLHTHTPLRPHLGAPFLQEVSSSSRAPDPLPAPLHPRCGLNWREAAPKAPRQRRRLPSWLLAKSGRPEAATNSSQLQQIGWAKQHASCASLLGAEPENLTCGLGSHMATAHCSESMASQDSGHRRDPSPPHGSSPSSILRVFWARREPRQGCSSQLVTWLSLPAAPHLASSPAQKPLLFYFSLTQGPIIS